VLLAGATAVAALIGSLVAALGTAGIARDVVRLRDEARRVAMGELTTPVASNRDDELGELAGSLERMRLSLQEGLERLRQRKR
jgi:HAMP domain-containing protein